MESGAEEHLAAEIERVEDVNVTSGEEALDETLELKNDFVFQDSVNAAVVAKYEKEWLMLRKDACEDELGELRRRALIGNLRSSRFRSVSWRLMLRLLPPCPEAWSSVLLAQREHYGRLSEVHHVTPINPLTGEDNPLSQDDSSTWHKFFCNKELQAVIRQDVVRTFPGIDFFREKSIQEKMVAILFCYARTNPDMCYRQGMHEILAPLLFVLHSDHQALMHAREHAPVMSEIIQVLDPQNLEADAYTLFCRIMSAIESSYRISNVAPSSTGHFPYETCKEVLSKRRDSKHDNELLAQLNYIHDNILVPKDPELANHLVKLDIPLTLFGIRWLRLLFGREFPLQDLLVLWDAIFAEFNGSKFELVDFIVVAMLIAIKHQLMAGDNTVCLTLLMRYPGAVDITNIIEHSLYLKEPDKYCLPATTSFQNLPVITIGGQTNLNRGPVNVKQANNTQSKAPKAPVCDPQTSNDKKGKTAKKSNSLSIKRFGKISGGRWGKQPVASDANADNSIVEGFPPNDPVLVMTELNRAVQLIKDSQVQLNHHLAILDSINISAENHIKHALEGIKEVSEKLRSFQCLVLEVEPATEAGEVKPVVQQVVPSKSKQKQVPATPSPSSDLNVNLKVFSMSEGDSTKVVGAPLEDPFNVKR
ncbi:TBC1 domain family member 5 [Neocloeon triangulifer]|uniref:TBC1 domain family member 5 n=1 Tax=Neocloeon triangulifer TaxID=2078957 RepID=UPI00286EC515|nr:TBC1 domain family member 5 [Neocloeon triangulifer]